jgi:hypothetical protein
MNNKHLLKAFIFLLSFSFITVKAQKSKPFEGKIIYEISYPGMTLDSATTAMFPKETSIVIKNEKLRTDLVLGMGMSNITVADAKTKTIFNLVNMMGNKYFMKLNEDELRKNYGKKNLSIVKSKETKEILGYLCHKAYIKVNDKDLLTFYYTTEINTYKNLNWSNEMFKDIDGVLLQYETKQNNITMLMTAKSVRQMTIEDADLEIPADYRTISQQDLQKQIWWQLIINSFYLESLLEAFFNNGF